VPSAFLCMLYSFNRWQQQLHVRHASSSMKQCSGSLCAQLTVLIVLLQQSGIECVAAAGALPLPSLIGRVFPAHATSFLYWGIRVVGGGGLVAVVGKLVAAGGSHARCNVASNHANLC
jgi:hypothetical protein